MRGNSTCSLDQASIWPLIEPHQRPGHLTEASQASQGRQIIARTPYRPLTVLGRGGQINVWAPYRHLTGLARADKSTPGHLTDSSQASQVPTNQRLGTLQTPHRPRKGRQINARAPDRPLTGLARADKSATGHLTDTSQTSQGQTNQLPSTLHTPHRPRGGRQISAWAPSTGHCKLNLPRRGRQINAQTPYRPPPGLAGADKSTPGHLTYPSQASQGPKNQRPGTMQTPHRPRKG